MGAPCCEYLNKCLAESLPTAGKKVKYYSCRLEMAKVKEIFLK